MNELSIEDRTRILNCLIEGMSVRATSRIIGAAKGTILRLIRTVGPACREFMNDYFVDLPCEHIEMDECWAFVRGKDRNLPERFLAKEYEGSVWSWIATCRECKLIADYAVGPRNFQTAAPFMKRLAQRFNDRVQVTTDGLSMYLPAIALAFDKGAVDYAMEVKEYGGGGDADPARKYSPASITSWKKKVKIGNPNMELASTSHAERVFLSLRMENRRFTRLTNAHSKKIEYHRAMFSIWTFYYNLVRKHSALRGKTPAMVAGITEHPFTMRDMLFAADQADAA